MRRFSFPQSCRLRKRADFVSVSKRGKVFSGRCFSVMWLRTEFSCVRLGLTVTARKGSAVERNLFKRRAREAFRHSSLRHQKGVDINLRPQNSLAVSYQEFETFFKSLETWIAAYTKTS